MRVGLSVLEFASISIQEVCCSTYKTIQYEREGRCGHSVSLMLVYCKVLPLMISRQNPARLANSFRIALEGLEVSDTNMAVDQSIYIDFQVTKDKCLRNLRYHAITHL